MVGVFLFCISRFQNYSKSELRARHIHEHSEVLLESPVKVDASDSFSKAQQVIPIFKSV